MMQDQNPIPGQGFLERGSVGPYTYEDKWVSGRLILYFVHAVQFVPATPGLDNSARPGDSATPA